MGNNIFIAFTRSIVAVIIAGIWMLVLLLIKKIPKVKHQLLLLLLVSSVAFIITIIDFWSDNPFNNGTFFGKLLFEYPVISGFILGSSIKEIFDIKKNLKK